MRHEPRQEVGPRDEIGVEDGDELTARHLQAGLERTRLVPGPIGAVDVVDVDAFGREAADRRLGNGPRLVGRVIEHLDFQQLARVIDAAHRIDQPIRDVHFVVERQLDGDSRQGTQRRERQRVLVPVPHVQVDQVIAVPPVNCENNQDEEIRGQREGLSGSHRQTSTIRFWHKTADPFHDEPVPAPRPAR